MDHCGLLLLDETSYSSCLLFLISKYKIKVVFSIDIMISVKETYLYFFRAPIIFVMRVALKLFKL